MLQSFNLALQLLWVHDAQALRHPPPGATLYKATACTAAHSFTVQTTGRNKLDGRHALTRRGAQLLGCRLAEAGCFTAYMITQLRCSLLLGSGTTTVLVCRSVALMQE